MDLFNETQAWFLHISHLLKAFLSLSQICPIEFFKININLSDLVYTDYCCLLLTFIFNKLEKV